MSYIMWIPPSMAGTVFVKTSPNEDGVGCSIEWDEGGEWVSWDDFYTKKRPDNVTDKDLEGWWAMLRDNRPISNKVKKLIGDTLGGKLEWFFSWCWFTGGSWFPTFITKDSNGDMALRAQIAWPQKEWGFIVVVTGDGEMYDSILDDENIPEIGMELWHLIEDMCINREELISEMNKRVEATEKGEHYPPLPTATGKA